ncbi:MAG: sensor domain-containing diguanylate cyclase [Terriglobales bacterium]
MHPVELINLIARSAASTGDMEQFLDTLAGLIHGAFQECRVSILLRERDGSLALRGYAGSGAAPPNRFAESQQSGIIAQALEARQNVVANDAGTRPGWPAALEDAGSELCVPLVSLGETLGVVLVVHPRPNAFPAEDRALAQTACDVCALAINNVLLSEELRRATSTDSLTGAYNQRYFHVVVTQELSRARRTQRPFALVLLDIRNFREVNQLLGAGGADRILREVGHALASQAGSHDTLFRYAGDQFALVLPETGPERLHDLVARLHQAVKRVEVTTEGGSLALSAVSAAALHPQDGETELELIRVLLARAQAAKE